MQTTKMVCGKITFVVLLLICCNTKKSKQDIVINNPAVTNTNSSEKLDDGSEKLDDSSQESLPDFSNDGSGDGEEVTTALQEATTGGTEIPWPDIWDLDIGYEEECRKQMYPMVVFQNAPYSVFDIFCRCYLKMCTMELTEEQLRMKDQINNKLVKMKLNNNLTMYISIGVTLGIVALVGILGNAMVLLTIIKYLPRGNVTYIFITSLGIADLLVVSVCTPLQAVNFIYQQWKGGEALCYIVNYLYYTCFMGSVFSLTAMSLERYFAICHPMKAQYLSTPGRARRIVVMLWIVSVLTAIPSAFIVESTKNRCTTQVVSGHALWFSFYILIVIFIIPTILMGFAYGRISVTLWRSIAATKDMHAKGSTKDGDKPKAKSTDEERIQVIKMLVTVLMIFVICWAPILLYYLFMPLVINPMQLLNGHQVMVIRLTLLVISYANSCVNPILYAFLSRQFRKGFKKFFYVCGVTPEKDMSSVVTRSTAVSKGSSSVAA